MTEARQSAAAPRRRLSPGDVGAISAAAALLAATALTAPSEGYRARPYWDPAHIRSYCFGETERVVERTYSKGECSILLEHRLAADYAPALERCLPELVDEKRAKIFAAFLDAAYNAGAGAVCRSRMAVAVRAHQWAGGCRGFYGWRATATDRRTGKRTQLKGLELRREREAALCLAGVAEQERAQ
jgi:lysozyme